jgi:hypothetical protein
MIEIIFFLLVLVGGFLCAVASVGQVPDQRRQHRYKPKTAIDDITYQFKRSSRKLKKELKRQYYYEHKRRK